MDYYSNFPGPSAESVIQQFIEEVKVSNPKEPKWKVEMCAKLAIDDMGGESKFGSATGWIVFGKKEFTQKALYNLKNYKPKKKIRFSLKTLSKMIILLNQMHRRSIERVWVPGGLGFQEAFLHFNSLKHNVVKLPPIK